MTLLFLATAAHALSNFPAVVSDHLVMDCNPTCTLCHTSPAGGAGTATQPFAENLFAEGFVSSDEATLTAALDAVQAAGTSYDANADGVNDVDELTLGEDPNPDGSDYCPADGDAPPTLTRGCFSSGGYASLLGIGLMAAGFRRARRR